jgi:hypothetical protein
MALIFLTATFNIKSIKEAEKDDVLSVYIKNYILRIEKLVLKFKKSFLFFISIITIHYAGVIFLCIIIAQKYGFQCQAPPPSELEFNLSTLFINLLWLICWYLIAFIMVNNLSITRITAKVIQYFCWKID